MTNSCGRKATADEVNGVGSHVVGLIFATVAEGLSELIPGLSLARYAR
jgi:hypothetical protein